jgi:hypothetical protein
MGIMVVRGDEDEDEDEDEEDYFLNWEMRMGLKAIFFEFAACLNCFFFVLVYFCV